jgi:hypothetical protein
VVVLLVIHTLRVVAVARVELQLTETLIIVVVMVLLLLAIPLGVVAVVQELLMLETQQQVLLEARQLTFTVVRVVLEV